MFQLIALGVTFGSAFIGFFGSRRFVRDRLRFVDAVQNRGVPLLAALGAAIVAAPIVWLLPIVGGGTALLFGASVGLGVSAGVKDVRRADYRLGSGL